MPAFKLFMFFLFLSFLSNFLGFTTTADPTYLTHFCPNTTTFTRNSTFQSNLNLFLSSLPTNASRSNGFSGGFYNATAGQPSYSDRVYGLFRCRSDLGSTACQDSVTFAARNISQCCPLKNKPLYGSTSAFYVTQTSLSFLSPTCLSNFLCRLHRMLQNQKSLTSSWGT